MKTEEQIRAELKEMDEINIPMHDKLSWLWDGKRDALKWVLDEE